MKALLLACVALLAGCGPLGMLTPQTFNEKVAAGYVSAEGARSTADALLMADVIGVDDATNIQSQADVAREGIDVARALHVEQPAVGETRLESVTAVLRALTDYLNARAK